MKIELLGNADATAEVAERISELAQSIHDDPEAHRELIDQAMADQPNAAAILHRNYKAADALASALRDLRSAILKQKAATG